MILLFVPLVLVSSVAARRAPLEVKITAPQRAYVGVAPLIVGGEIVSSITQLPWQVYLQTNYGSDSTVSTCGGSVINPEWVLTAAHCVQQVTVKALWVTLMFGSTDSVNFQAKKLIVTVDAANIFPHEDYNREQIINDIAVIKLNTPLPISSNNNRISVIKLPTSCDVKRGRTFAGSSVTLSGWGKTNDTEEDSPVLKWVNTTVLTQAECVQQSPSGNANILPQFICAGAKVGGQSSCQGDSGGPMSFRETNGNAVLLGVTSFGWKCAEGTPSVYARTSYFLPWIAQKTGLKF